jgi:filamentous hemagglutinin family protein
MAVLVATGMAEAQPKAGPLVIPQTVSKTIITWESFQISPGKVVKVVQPSTQAILLNRVTNGQQTMLLGNLTANGQVMIINPSRIVAGAITVRPLTLTTSSLDGVINTSGIVAAQTAAIVDGRVVLSAAP